MRKDHHLLLPLQDVGNTGGMREILALLAVRENANKIDAEARLEREKANTIDAEARLKMNEALLHLIGAGGGGSSSSRMGPRGDDAVPDHVLASWLSPGLWSLIPTPNGKGRKAKPLKMMMYRVVGFTPTDISYKDGNKMDVPGFKKVISIFRGYIYLPTSCSKDLAAFRKLEIIAAADHGSPHWHGSVFKLLNTKTPADDVYIGVFPRPA
jgi:hypothetical protein